MAPTWLYIGWPVYKIYNFASQNYDFVKFIKVKMGFIKFIRVKSGNLKKLLSLRKAVIKVRKAVIKVRKVAKQLRKLQKVRIGDFFLQSNVLWCNNHTNKQDKQNTYMTQTYVE